MKAAFYSFLPSGGAARVAGQQLNSLRDRFNWRAYQPEGGIHLLPESGVPFKSYPFPAGRRLKGPTRILAPVLLWRKAFAYQALCRRISDDINASGARVLLSHPSMIIAAPPLLYSQEPPSVYYCHEYPRYIYEKGIYKTGSAVTDLLIAPLLKWEKKVDRHAARNAEILVANSAFTAAKLREVYQREVVIVTPGVDTDFFSPGGSKGDFVLTVGALSEFKRHHLVVEALSLIPEKCRPRMITVADRGDEDYAEFLSSLALKTGVELTIERGVSDSRLLELYRRAVVTVCPQRNEPYGLVPLEAMACGTGVVAVNQGGFRENVIHGENGFLVEPEASTIAEAVLKFFTDAIDLSAMSARGRDFVLSERSVHVETGKMADLLETAAGMH